MGDDSRTSVAETMNGKLLITLAAATRLAFAVEQYAGWYSTGSVLQSRECGLATSRARPARSPELLRAVSKSAHEMKTGVSSRAATNRYGSLQQKGQHTRG